jgi:hypothetical protein
VSDVDWRIARRVLVEGDPSRGAQEDEELAISSEATRRGFTVQSVSLRGMPRALLQPVSIVAGSLPFVETALRTVGASIPDPMDYPPVLQRFYDRRIWPSTVSQVRRLIEDGNDPVFVKPAARRVTIFRFRRVRARGPLAASSSKRQAARSLLKRRFVDH